MSEEQFAAEGVAVGGPVGARSGDLAAVRWIVAVVVALVWAFVIVKLNGLNGDVSELTDDFFDSASAPQITQVATQAMVQQLLYLGFGLAGSAVGVVVCLAARRD